MDGKVDELLLDVGGGERAFDTTPVFIGSSHRADIVIDGDEVFSNHAMIIRQEDGTFVIADLATGGRTVLVRQGGSAPVLGVEPFATGDKIRIGKTEIVNVSGNPPAYKGNEPFIFISYWSGSKAEVGRYIRAMQKHRYRVWYDEGLPPARDWKEPAADRVRACDLFLLFVSEKATRSKPICRELEALATADRSPAFAVVLLKDAPDGDLWRQQMNSTALEGDDKQLNVVPFLEAHKDRNWVKKEKNKKTRTEAILEILREHPGKNLQYPEK